MTPTSYNKKQDPDLNTTEFDNLYFNAEKEWHEEHTLNYETVVEKFIKGIYWEGLEPKLESDESDEKEADKLCNEFKKFYDNEKKEKQGNSLDYELALRNDVTSIIFKEWIHLPSLKASMIFECVAHKNYTRAVDFINLMNETEKYLGYSCRENEDGKWVGYCWEDESKNTIIYVINQTYKLLPMEQGESRGTFRDIHFSDEMINSVVYLSRLVIPHLSKYAAKDVENALVNILDDEESEARFIKGLLEDVQIFTTFPKPRGMGGAQQYNRITHEMQEGFKTLSNKGRIDILSEILHMLYSFRGHLKANGFSGWMSNIALNVSGETCTELFKSNQQIFRDWISTANSKDIISWAKKMGQGCSRKDFQEFSKLVNDTYGRIPELENYYKEKLN